MNLIAANLNNTTNPSNTARATPEGTNSFKSEFSSFFRIFTIPPILSL